MTIPKTRLLWSGNGKTRTVMKYISIEIQLKGFVFIIERFKCVNNYQYVPALIVDIYSKKVSYQVPTYMCIMYMPNLTQRQRKNTMPVDWTMNLQVGFSPK